MNNVSVNVYPVKDGGTLKANVSICIDETVVINDFKIIEGKNGLFISNPQRAYKDGKETKYRDVVYFMDQDVKTDIEDSVFAEYEKTQKGSKRSGRK